MAQSIPQLRNAIKPEKSALDTTAVLIMLGFMNSGQLLKGQIQAGAKARRQGVAVTDNPWTDSQWDKTSPNIRKLADAWATGWRQQDSMENAKLSNENQ